MGQKLITGLIVLLVGVGGYLYWKVDNLSDNSQGVKSFDFVLQGKAYIPDTIEVNLGDTVVFNIDNRDNENHGLHLPQFGVNQAVPPLAQTSVQFVATKAGTVATSCATDHPEKINVIVNET